VYCDQHGRYMSVEVGKHPQREQVRSAARKGESTEVYETTLALKLGERSFGLSRKRGDSYFNFLVCRLLNFLPITTEDCTLVRYFIDCS